MKVDLQSWLAELLDCEPSHLHRSAVAGGDINQSECVQSPDGQRIFLKSNSNASLLRSEAESLQLMDKLGAQHYPTLIDFTDINGHGFLALEFEDLVALNSSTAPRAADSLVKQHEITNNDFGWPTSNHIGFTAQPNDGCDSWLSFYAEQRLAPQVSLASQRGLNSTCVRHIEWLMVNLDQRIDEAGIRPALLHGDLWVGNLSATRVAGQAGILFYDPAPYFGDSEVDIAMSKLFGRLPEAFYRHYRAQRPAPKDLDTRFACYDLYHALNHFNMFGRAYETMVARLLDTLI